MRLRKTASIFITIIFCGIFLPLCLHWTQHENGWLNSIYDSTGATTVHLASSVVGIIGSVSLGRRLLKVSEIDICSVSTGSPSNTFMGYFLIIIAVIGNLLYSSGNGLYQIDIFDSILVTNSMMTIGGSIITFSLVHCCSHSNYFNYWDNIRCLQSTVSALIALSLGVEYYLPSSAFVIGILSSACFYIISIIIDLSFIEDSCNIIATHLTAVTIGAILLPFLCELKFLGENATVLTRFSKCGKQILYCLVIIFCSCAIFIPIFLLLKAVHLLRSKTEIKNHTRAVNLLQNKNIPWYSRIFNKRSSIPLAKSTTNGASSSVILETRGSERRRPWITRGSDTRRVSFLDSNDNY